MRADRVIAGAGSAGCILINRPMDDPGTRVLPIEAGGRDWHPTVRITVRQMKLLDHPTLTWGLRSSGEIGRAHV